MTKEHLSKVCSKQRKRIVELECEVEKQRAIAVKTKFSLSKAESKLNNTAWVWSSRGQNELEYMRADKFIIIQAGELRSLLEEVE